jgi:hypothetical protein
MSGVSLEAGLRRAKRSSPVSFFEFWPGWLFYAPVVAFWAINALRHRSITLPTLANPRIEAGGLVGESKNDILDLAGPLARAAIAPYIGLTTTGHCGGDDIGIAEAARERAGLAYPLVAKPDMSCNGVGVRIVRDREALARYLAEFPRATRLQLQTLVTHEGEAGIFYIREPHEARGRITSVTLKYPPTVTGDGHATVKALIEADPRLHAISHLLLPKLGARAASVPAAGESVRLVFVGNHCRGSTFRCGAHIVTEALTARIDAIARDIPDLHFARFDLRYHSLPELREGNGFTIIEVNGTGSEATNIWDPDMTLRTAYATQFFHYGAAFRIGAALRAAGRQPTTLARLFGLWRTQKRLMRRYPDND